MIAPSVPLFVTYYNDEIPRLRDELAKISIRLARTDLPGPELLELQKQQTVISRRLDEAKPKVELTLRVHGIAQVGDHYVAVVVHKGRLTPAHLVAGPDSGLVFGAIVEERS